MCFIFSFVLASLFSRATNDLLAYYPLSTNGLDATGLNSYMTLTNAPFLNGGVYCNGTLNYSVITPTINNFSFSNMSISFDFYVKEFKNQPVISCGSTYRWLGFFLNSNHTVKMLYNNANYAPSTLTYDTARWYHGNITYDGTTARIYLNASLAASYAVALDYIATDTRISTRYYASSGSFKGYIKNLRIANYVNYGITEAIEKEISFYPNPANDFLLINGADNGAVIKIFDLSGKLVSSKQNNSEPIDIRNLQAGVYIILVENNEMKFAQRFMKK